jgi:hypothetical protein
MLAVADAAIAVRWLAAGVVGFAALLVAVYRSALSRPARVLAISALVGGLVAAAIVVVLRE